MRYLILALLCGALGCKDSKTADDVKPCVKSSGQTAGEAAKTGAKTAVEGVKTFGESVGGLFDGGKEEAKRRWDEGKQKTKDTAKTGGAETEASAQENECE